MVEFSIFTPSDQEDVLRLIERSISTNRTGETWQGNPMTAVLARDNGKLVGALPMEVRDFLVKPGETRKVGWISAAHVDEAYRSKGLGSRLDAKAREAFAGNLDGFMVYREDETSPAYRWYARQGYVPLMPILAYKKDISSDQLQTTDKWIETSNSEQIGSMGVRLQECFARCHALVGGFPARDNHFWQRSTCFHYYRDDIDKYILLAIHAEGAISPEEPILAFAFLAKTSMRDGIDRYELFEFSAPDNSTAKRLLEAVEVSAQKRGLGELRVQFSGNDPLKDLFVKLGFTSRQRRTNIMASALSPKQLIKRCLKRSKLSLSIATPSLGLWTVGNKEDALSLSIELSDQDFMRLLWCRLNLHVGIYEGRIACVDGSTAAIEKLSQSFSPEVWRYFQLDYI